MLDLACGTGRHAAPLAGRAGRVVGLERSAAYLRRAAAQAGAPCAAAPLYVRGDLRRLPLRAGAFDAAFSWYASLFMYDDAGNAAALAELARVVRPGGRLLVHHANPLRLAREPDDASRRSLPDGSVVEEVSRFDPATGVDRCRRRLIRPSGSVLAGTAELRYYSPAEWGPLAERTGLRVLGLTCSTDAEGSPRSDLGPDAPDLIALLERTERHR